MAENQVSIAIKVQAPDLSPFDTVKRRLDELLAQEQRLPGRPGATDVPSPAPGSGPPSRPSPGVAGPTAPPVSQEAIALHRQLMGLQAQQAQIDQRIAPTLFDEIDRKRRSLEAQLAKIDPRTPPPEAPPLRPDVPGAALVARQPPQEVPAAPAPPVRAPRPDDMPPRPRPALPTPQGPPPTATRPRPQEPPAQAPPPTPVAAWQARNIQLEATQRQLEEVQARQATLVSPRSTLAWHLGRREAQLQRRRETLQEAIAGMTPPAGPPPPPATVPSAAPAPEEDESEPGGSGARPGAIGRPRRSRMAGAAGRAMAGVGRGIVGGGIAGVAAGLTHLVATSVMDRVSTSLERYEQRVRSVGMLSQRLNTTYGDINERLDTMRERYALLGAEGVDVLEGISQSVGTPLGVMAVSMPAARFARSAGISPGAAGILQGQYMRLLAPMSGDTPLDQLADAQRERRGIIGLSRDQFVQQALGVAAVGGTAVPPPSGAFAANMTDFLGSLGPRYPGQQAATFERFAQGISTPTAEPFQALRIQALSKLGAQRPGGILTVGEGPFAEKINLRTWEGILQGLELAGSSPEIAEAFAQAGQSAGGSSPELQRMMMRGMVTPGMIVTEGNRFMRGREALGARGFAELGVGRPTAPGAADARIAAQEPQYAAMLQLSANMEKRMEGIGAQLLETKQGVDAFTINVLEGLGKFVTEVTRSTTDTQKLLQDGSGPAQQTEQHTRQAAGFLGDMARLIGEVIGTAQAASAAEALRWRAPMLPQGAVTPQYVR